MFELKPKDIDEEDIERNSEATCVACNRYINTTKQMYFECSINPSLKKSKTCRERDGRSNFLCRQCGTCELGHVLRVSTAAVVDERCARKHYRYFHGK